MWPHIVVTVAGGCFPMLKSARSFEEALDVASDEILSSSRCEGTSDGPGENMVGNGEGTTIMCWVGGGERPYGASEVHLTHVDVTLNRKTEVGDIVYFSLECLTEHGYVETSRRDVGISRSEFTKEPKRR
jgi:hypothetical protein